MTGFSEMFPYEFAFARDVYPHSLESVHLLLSLDEFAFNLLGVAAGGKV